MISRWHGAPGREGFDARDLTDYLTRVAELPTEAAIRAGQDGNALMRGFRR